MGKRLLGQVAAGLGSLAIAWVCFWLLRNNAMIAALFLLLGVLLIAAYASRPAALSASIFATLGLDYFFIPPVGRINVSDPEGWLALAVFLTVSLVGTDLSTRLRRRRDELAEHQAELEKLHTLNRAVLLSDGGSNEVQRILVNKCMELFGFEEAALFESATGLAHRSRQEGLISEAGLRKVAHNGAVETSGRATTIPIALGNKIFGSFAFIGEPQTAGLAQGLGNAMAVSLAQAQTQQAASRAEAVRRSEELKSVMIDALAHELKTPLTAIEAAADMLHGGRVSAEQRDELVDIVQQEAQRLRRLMGEAIHLARIEAKRFKLARQSTRAGELIQRAIDALGQKVLTHPIRVSVEESSGPLLVMADPELIAELVKQLLDNALKYSAAGKPISVTAEEENGLVSIRVRDEGPGLTELEQRHVFDKFYRTRRDSAGVQGTGMGLAIAREIAEAHGGTVRVDSQMGKGTEFTVTLPAVALDAILSESTSTRS